MPLHVLSTCSSSGGQNCTKKWIYSIYLNINQLDALNFIMSLFRACTCFEHHVLIVRRLKLY